MNVRWFIGSSHPEYGEVVMCGVLSGEAYRWFERDGVISMIPLDALGDEEGGDV